MPETAAALGTDDVEQIKGQKFRDLFRKLIVLDNVVIDVGASNIEPILDGMDRHVRPAGTLHGEHQLCNLAQIELISGRLHSSSQSLCVDGDDDHQKKYLFIVDMALPTIHDVPQGDACGIQRTG